MHPYSSILTKMRLAICRKSRFENFLKIRLTKPLPIMLYIVKSNLHSIPKAVNPFFFPDNFPLIFFCTEHFQNLVIILCNIRQTRPSDSVFLFFGQKKRPLLWGAKLQADEKKAFY